METMKQIFQGEKDMLDLKEQGKIEESALVGFEIIKAFSIYL
jgi:hypothetical protein